MENTGMAHLPYGTLLQRGRYKVVRFISSGGFGCTYEAEHTTLKRRVAVKEFFVKDFCNRDNATLHVTVATVRMKELVDKLRRKFIEEAQFTSSMQHPHIVKVYDVFEENGTAYYVMDYIDGPSLEILVKESGPLSEEMAVNYIRQVADALGYVHSFNRLHLDLKPGNIMTDGHGNAILVDFGVSKQYDEVGGENTSTLMGKTPGYAPIEQLGNDVKKFTPATDIYALGATLYKLLTGVTPPGSNILASGEEELPSLPRNISEGTANAVYAAMQVAKSKRPQSVADFLSILDYYGDEEEIEATVIDNGGAGYSDDAEEQYNLGCQYCLGDGVPKDLPQAVYWWRKAAEQGHAMSQFFLGRCYYNGEGVPADDKQAVYWIKKAAEQGLVDAQYYLGWYYEGCGMGVVKNFSEAIKWYTAAAKQGDEDAIRRLSEMGLPYNSGDGDDLINGHEYVDLGLQSGVRWATCNVGASSPSDYGNYYAWGETREKSSYDRSNCVTFRERRGDVGCDPQYDAARAVWGDPWRLPTAAEIDELVNTCTREWVTVGGHQGYKITGPNGNSIFLPAAGFRDGTSLKRDGKNGYYWSETPYEGNKRTAYGLSFGKNYVSDMFCATPYAGDSEIMYALRQQTGCFFRFWHSRYPGQSIRPVAGTRVVYAG